MAAIASFLVPLAGEGVAFLRILRTVRLLRSYELLARLRRDSRFFCRHEEAILAATNLLVFIFVMTGLVYETQHWTNPHIGNYADALYFTVTALTTTGFGDITLPGTHGPHDLGHRDDLRRDALPAPGPGPVPAQQGALQPVRPAGWGGMSPMRSIARPAETSSTSPTTAQEF